jgi:hypothetical protein
VIDSKCLSILYQIQTTSQAMKKHIIKQVRVIL